MAAPIRVLRVITRLNIGGPAIHAALLSNRLDPGKFSTCLVTGTPDATEGDLSDLLQRERVSIIRLRTFQRPLRPWADLVTLWRLLRIAWRERPRIIHTHTAKAGALGRLAGFAYNRLGPGRRRGARALLIHTFHGHVLEGYFSPRLTRFFITIERWLARRTDRLVAVNRIVRNELMGKGIGRSDQWQVIPLGLDLANLAQLPLPNGSAPMRVGLVGRLVPIKNPALFLKALHRLMRQGAGQPVTGVVVGDGPLRHLLERETQRLGLERLVRFTGWQRDLRAVYEGLEVTCLTSWNEGTPVALIEAMAAGRAVVATTIGGVGDLLDDEIDPPTRRIAPGAYRVAARGVLVRPGDAEALADALALLAANRPLCLRLGEAARAYVVERFTQERLVRDITAFYEGLPIGT